ncbi:MAG: 3'-5' exonuclease [Lentisphaeria bacterium]|jgi:DNA polymerase-3 subunit epsilon
MADYAVIDFETTGLSAGWDRTIEVGAAIVRDGEVVATFAQLMHPGFPIPTFITGLTGITNAMVRGQPPPEAVMPELHRFLAGHTCVAHNAAFDARFFAAEMARAGLAHERPFLCTMRLARRLVPEAPNHQLGTLVRHLRLETPAGTRAHRALDDVLMTVALWNHLAALVGERLGAPPPPEILAALMKKSKAAAAAWLCKLAAPSARERRP